MERMGDRAERLWWPTLALLAAVRVVVPLAVLAAEGHKLPAVPRYVYGPLYGDANGYYAGLREFQAAVGRLSPALLATILLVLIVGGSAALANNRRENRWFPSWVALVALTAVCAVGVTLAIVEMKDTGAAVIGWSLVWATLELPFRAVGLVPTPSVAFGFGLALSFAANVATIVATAYLGLYVTGRRAVGLGAAVLLALWPLLVGALTASGGWENGMWIVDTGLGLYTEPLSTALVVCSLLLALRFADRPLPVAAAGSLLAFSTVVKLSNVTIVVLVGCALVLRIGVRATLPFVLASAVWVPALIAYWPKGYVGIYDGQTSASAHPWGVGHVDDAWLHSTLFTPLVLLLLVPVGTLGIALVRGWYPRLLVLGTVVVTASLYSFYDMTAIHPRFLYVALPCVFILDAAGVAWLVTRCRPKEEAVRAVV
jgi:hypothetical protein